MLIARRTLEIATAAALGIFAAAVVQGALQLDHGWGSTGPQSGYMPLRLGVLLLLVSAGLLYQAVRQSRDGEPFATGEQLGRSLSLFAPTVVMAVAMGWLGVYLTAAVYLVFMARRHGGLGWPKALLLGPLVLLLFFGIFELWFGVPLVKGP
ncbi:MAG: tripartite tricarboxylate transporter TctB family protein, partial [Ideonella sp.]